MISRRDFLASVSQTVLIAGCAPIANALSIPETQMKPVRCINVVNFIRGVEPRFKTDLLLPVRKQMEIILQHKLPATWLLQYDALVSGPFVEYLKENKAANHEIGTWFEMNQMHCEAAGVEWRGRPGYEWDHLPPVAFTIGYSPEERIKLAEAAMAKFKSVWGFYPKSVASWNLDSITMLHLTENYGVEAFAVCRDQIATDGFTIWGAPIAGYYPSKINCWSPALDPKNQIPAPVFRMLGQDPVYYYNREYRLPDGKRIGEPDTMEPVWTSGRSPRFVETFLDMISEAPTLQFGYAQLGQENSFPWSQMEPGFAPQMAALAQLRDSAKVQVETMGDTGRRFKRQFKQTPPQAQVQLDDPFGNTDPAQSSIWYQSRFFRANLHLQGELAFIRDITVYSDQLPQPFLKEATRQNDVEQRMPPLLDGYHWRKSGDTPGSGGFFLVDGKRAILASKPKVREDGNNLIVDLELTGGRRLNVRFTERTIAVRLEPNGALGLSFEWDPAKSAMKKVEPQEITYRTGDLDYSVRLKGATALATEGGWTVRSAKGTFTLDLAQAR